MGFREVGRVQDALLLVLTLLRSAVLILPAVATKERSYIKGYDS